LPRSGQVDCLPDSFDRRHAGSQCDRRADRVLQHGVSDQIVGYERLLDVRQMKVIEPIKQIALIESQLAAETDRQRSTSMSQPGRNLR
jgi:hypothetical protein